MEKPADSTLGAAEAATSFASLRAYRRALAETPRRLRRRVCSATTTYEEMSRVRARSGSDMARALRWPDLVGLGLGGMVGAGVFVTTGRAAREDAGPAIVVSYAIAGLCALLSAFCYTEFAVDMPVAGGAFSYLRVTFGEFAAFLTGANLIMEYVFSNAAVSRSFTAYLGTMIGVDTEARWRITVSGFPEGFNQIDLLAVAVVLIITVCICYSTKESSLLNLVLTSVHLAFILFIIVMGIWRGDSKNFTHPANPEKNPGGFFPYGFSGVIHGAALVYLSYIGYDAVSTMAEEVKNPARDIPIGVSGSVVLVTVLYCLMAASMAMLLPYDAVRTFAELFVSILNSISWVAIGASRSPPWVDPSDYRMRFRSTVKRKQGLSALGVFTAALALFTELDVLINLVSIGTLFVFYMVANAVIYRRYVTAGSTNPRPTISFLLCFSFASLAFTFVWNFAPSGRTKAVLLGTCAVLAIAILQTFQLLVPQARKPEFWGVPLMPWIPSFSIFLNLFLLGSLDRPSYVRFGVFSVLVILVYVFYGVHASFDAEENGDLHKAGDSRSHSEENNEVSFRV